MQIVHTSHLCNVRKNGYNLVTRKIFKNLSKYNLLPLQPEVSEHYTNTHSIPGLVHLNISHCNQQIVVKMSEQYLMINGNIISSNTIWLIIKYNAYILCINKQLHNCTCYIHATKQQELYLNEIMHMYENVWNVNSSYNNNHFL